MPDPRSSAGEALVRIARTLRRAVDPLTFGPPVTHVYDPLDYARATHERYLRLARSGAEVLLVGMNPGPFGMVQTGVPFGEVSIVRDWIGIEGPVGRPAAEHPKRPVAGFACARSEVSGARFWGWARDRFGTADAFFERFFVWNYCPLVFLEESGRNRTPDKLPAKERDALFEPCDAALASAVQALEPRLVVGIGRFARRRAGALLEGGGPAVGEVLHPSPASPLANAGWVPKLEERLAELGVRLPDRRKGRAANRKQSRGARGA